MQLLESRRCWPAIFGARYWEKAWRVGRLDKQAQDTVFGQQLSIQEVDKKSKHRLWQKVQHVMNSSRPYS